ncbi:MAG: hypothetical protein PUF51_06385 [Bifidobacteriaceae bacterium]|nr:hypothetical protein [Bifidobacteriaceae bacterium]
MSATVHLADRQATDSANGSHAGHRIVADRAADGGVSGNHADDGGTASSNCTYPYESLALPRIARVMIHRLRARIHHRLVAILLVVLLVLMVTFDFEYIFESLELRVPLNVTLSLGAAWAVCAALLYFAVVRPLKRLHRLSGTARGRGGTPALIEVMTSKQYRNVVDATSAASLPAVPVQDRGDTSMVVPRMAQMEQCLATRAGAAFPAITSADSLADPRFAAAWRVPETTSPLMAASGTVLDSLVFEVHSRLKESSDSQASATLQVHRARFYRVEFTDDGGFTRRIWSDSLWQRFGKGDAVTVYWYRVTSGAHAGIRIHDLADASLPVNVADHAVQLFNFAWSDVAEWLADGRPAKRRSLAGAIHDTMTKDVQLGPAMAPVCGSYGEALAGEPWGKEYRFLPVAGYCYERMPSIEHETGAAGFDDFYREDAATAAAGTEGAQGKKQGDGKKGSKKSSKKAARNASETRILHSAVWDVRPGSDDSQIWDVESPYETKLARVDGVARDAVEVPVFSRRRYCGQGYMALVEFNYNGFDQKVWAFGDPACSASYLGQDSPADLPVKPGDDVTLWLTRGEGPNLVAPKVCRCKAE